MSGEAKAVTCCSLMENEKDYSSGRGWAVPVHVACGLSCKVFTNILDKLGTIILLLSTDIHSAERRQENLGGIRESSASTWLVPKSLVPGLSVPEKAEPL